MTLKEILAQAGQSHLLDFANELTPLHKQQLEKQLKEIDFEQLTRLLGGQDAAVEWAELASRAEPPPAVRLDRKHPRFSAADAISAGEQALRDGRVAAILVAGGQGTRLGFNKPKGMFRLGPLSDRTLFQMHCDRLLAIMQRYDVSIPLYIMTSPATDAETRAYFEQNQRCGLTVEQLTVFSQGTMPAVDAHSGKVLMESKSTLALSPDGHGGLVAALDNLGGLKQARARGTDLFYYAQVDNPLAELGDPELLGYHLLASSQMTTQVVKKRYAREKVGNVVQVDGKVQIIEYSDLPDSAAEAVDAAGELTLWAGNIAVHVLDRYFLEQVVASAEGLPFHRALKAVPYIDKDGQSVTPDKPNALKFERFIFDLLPLAKRAFVVEGDPKQVFAPVKNANGAPVDTPAHSQSAILALHRSWLEAAGATVADGVRVELHPEWALDAAEVQTKIQPGQRFEVDTFLR